MKDSEARDIVEVSRMMGDPTRLGIIEILSKGPKAVMQICKSLNLPQPTVSHHLSLLRHTSMVDRKRKGKEMIYSLNKAQLAPLKKFLAQVK